MAASKERRTVLITGCSEGGIGYSMALAFHRRGLRVFATARSPSKMAQLAEQGIETLPLEVTDEQSIQACLRRVGELTEGRGLDYLVNNAGLHFPVAAMDLDLDAAKKIFDTNVFAVMRLCQVFGPDLIKAKGTIVMIGSVAGLMPYVFGSVYTASKAALHAYANTLRVELAPFDVKVITVVTGGVKSNIASHVVHVLPENSLYKPIEDKYNMRQTYSQIGAMPNEAYAESVVSQVVPGAGPWPWRWLLKDARKPWIWEGRESLLVYLVAGGWIWSRVFDLFFTLRFGMYRLRSKSKQV